jgi:WD40 repeat protein
MQAPALHAWRLDNREDIELLGYEGRVRSLSWNTDGRWLATSGGPGVIMWSIESENGPRGTIPTLLAHRPNSIATAVACHPRDNIIAVGFDDGLIAVVLPIDDRKLVLRPPGNGAISCLSWDAEGVRMAFGAESGECGLIDFG